MTINQLFKTRPSQEKVVTILEYFNLTGFDDTKSFTKKELKEKVKESPSKETEDTLD